MKKASACCRSAQSAASTITLNQAFHEEVIGDDIDDEFIIPWECATASINALASARVPNRGSTSADQRHRHHPYWAMCKGLSKIAS
jgi:hypothetical protein